jgi:hypothetical protein
MVSNLVRKAYFVARKLKIKSFQTWLSNELNGYKNVNDIPEYRKLRSIVQAKVAPRMWVSVIDASNQLSQISIVNCNNSIAEVEEFFKSDGLAYQKFNDETVILLGKITNQHADFRGAISPTEYLKIINFVRSNILEWSIQLEEEGILGKGLSFTKEDQVKAQHINNVINNFNGDINQSQIQQNGTYSSQALDIETINRSQVEKLLNDIREIQDKIQFNNKKDSQDFNNQINIIENQLASTTPENEKIKSSILLIKKIISGVTTNIITTGIMAAISNLNF